MRDVFITGVGSYSPGAPIPFTDIESVLGKLDKLPPKVSAWVDRMKPIMEGMLGVEYVHYAMDPATREPTESVVSMSVKSADKALEMAGLKANDLDLLVFGGITFENFCPPTSALIQEAMGIQRVAEYSIHSNCTSTYKALQLATDQLALGRYDNALIVSTQLSSPFLRAEFYNQEVVDKSQILLRWFLSDGSGALLLTTDPKQVRRPAFKVVHTYNESMGLGQGPDMYCVVGGNRVNMLEAYKHGWHHLTQNFDRVAKLSIEFGKQASDTMMERTGMKWEDIDYFMINVPTKHIFDQVNSDLKRGKNLTNLKFFSKLATRGYPGPCAIIHGIDDFLKDEKPNNGDIVASVVAESSKWMYGGFALEYLG
jgi:3-oxoacyl-[acyl-carrier-protein] synthase-3